MRWVWFVIVAFLSAGVGAFVTNVVDDDPSSVRGPAISLRGPSDCQVAFLNLSKLWHDRIKVTYAPIDRLRNGQSQEHYLDVFRKASGQLDAIEVELDAMEVPEAVLAIHDLEREFVNILRTAYDDVIQAIDDDDPQATAIVQTGHARASEVYAAVQEQLNGFDVASQCA